jgi:hypothetical protein
MQQQPLAVQGVDYEMDWYLNSLSDQNTGYPGFFP